MSAWPPSLVNQSVHPAKCRANCFWDRKSRDGSSKGMVRGEGGGVCVPFQRTDTLSWAQMTNFVCKPRRIQTRLRWFWGGAVVSCPKWLEVSQRFGFGHGKGLPICWGLKPFFPTKSTRYPALNRLKAVALPAVRRLISPTHLQKL